VVVLAALRLPWLEADGGNFMFWSYGSFSTDEAAYSSGGRLAYLSGSFLDPEVGEPYTFLNSWGMHLLSYLGYLVRGLSFGAARLATMMIAATGWLAVYSVLIRRTTPWLAGLLVLLVSSNPVSLTYERVVSSDVVLGGLCVIAYASLTSRRVAWAWLAGATAALASSVKPTAVGFLPLFALTLWSLPGLHWRRLIKAGVAFAVVFVMLWLWREHCIQAVTTMNRTQVLTALSHGTPSLHELRMSPLSWLKAVAIFPRWPLSMQLGPIVVWMAVLCVATLFLKRRRGVALALGLLVYLLAVGSQDFSPLRYWLPSVFFVPLLLASSRPLIFKRRLAWGAGTALVATLFALYWWWPDRTPTPAYIQQHVYNEYTVPQVSPLSVFGWRIVAGLALMVALLRFGAGASWIAAGVLAFGMVWTFFANHTISLMNIDRAFVINQITLQIIVLSTAALLLYRGRRIWWYGFHAGGLLACWMLNSYWSQTTDDLLTRRFTNQTAAAQLASHLPESTIVVGRPAPSLLRATPYRLGLANYSWESAIFVNQVESLLVRYPDRSLYWLVDSTEPQLWNYYQQHLTNLWSVTPITTVRVPSGDLLAYEAVDYTDLTYVPLNLFRVHE